MKLDTKGIAILAFIAGLLAFFFFMPNKGVMHVPEALNIQTLDGEKFTLGSLQGKPYMLTFWSTSCPGCVKEIPVLQALNQTMQNSGFRIIGVAMPTDIPPEIQAMRAQKGMTYTVAHDQSGELMKQFDVRVTPTSFLIGADGNIAARKMGEWNPTELEQKVRELLKG
jgi:peroxiredoxin